MARPNILPAKAKAHLAYLFPYSLLVVPLAATLIPTWLFFDDPWTKIFITLFVVRYTRLVGHVLGSWIYRPSEITPDPAFTRGDVTVIIPTVEPQGPNFRECILSIIANQPHRILVVTVGSQLYKVCNEILEGIGNETHYTGMSLAALPEASKRRQVAHAVRRVRNAITILADDHVFWPENFIPSVLAPLDDPSVGMVATKKRVRRMTPGEWSWPSIVNFIACNHLQRHNWELRTSNAIDGGVFLISGGTAVYRTEVLDAQLLERLCSEKFFFGRLGGTGLGPDDDNFLTREAMKKGWRIFFQDTEDGTIDTTLGEWPRFRGQLLRRARTTFRSNPVMLRDPVFLFRYPWSAFMVYWAGLVNFALFWDTALILSLVKIKGIHPAEIVLFLIWMLWTKVVKIIPNLYKHPCDVPFGIFQVLFGYVHSFLKLWALLTFWDCDWSVRNLDAVKATEQDAALDTSFRVV
ncbi:hypothetical protein ACHAPT_013454 [Fusarium lateritium]